MEGLKPPKHLVLEGNISENWKRWKQQFSLYMVASGGMEQDENVKVALFLHIIGPEALEKYNTFSLSTEESEQMDLIMTAFDKYCIPKVSETVCRHVFFARTQMAGESFDSFITDLKKLSVDCAFDKLRDSLIRDRIISGIKDKILKDRLLREGQLDLEKCIRMCKMAELTTQQMRVMEEEKLICEIKQGKDHKENWNSKKTPWNKKNFTNNIQTKNIEPDQRYKTEKPWICKKCGKGHPKFKCPAYQKICSNCKKYNHFAKMCKTKTVHGISENQQLQNLEEETEDFRTLYLNNVSTSINENEWYEKFTLLNNKVINAKLDTGAQCNVLPIQKFEQLNLNKNIIMSSMIKLKNYTGTVIKVIGKCKLLCKDINNTNKPIEFIVVDTELNTPIILGLPNINKLNLIKRVSVIAKEINNSATIIVQKYEQLFRGLGEINNYTYDIKLLPNAPGKIELARKVPLKMQAYLRDELKKMEKMGVVRRVYEPTNWVNSLVIVKKANKMRICLDPQHLNKYVQREYYTLPTLEEIVYKLKGGITYSTLDANKAFWQIKLSEQSALCTTFNTPFGRYCFQRLPYGLSSAPEIFHRCFKEIFDDIDGVEIYIDDILIWGATEQEHNDRLVKVLERAKQRGIRFNKEKCQIGVKYVKYLGHVLTPEGLKPDIEKVKAIKEIKQPKTRKELENFLGMITYVSKFIPNVSQLTNELRNLLKKNVIWNWESEHTKVFDELRNILSKPPVLQYFDVNKSITLSVDASQDGVGAVLLQDNLPVSYASKAFTEIPKP